MNNKLIVVLPLLIFLSAGTLFGVSPFENDRKSYDPYIADTGSGFNNLLVNPAGAAGQNSLVFSMEAGTYGSANDYKLVQSFLNLATASFNPSAASTSDVDMDEITDLFNSLSDTDLVSLLVGTTIAGSSTVTSAQLAGLTEDDYQQISQNVQNDPAILSNSLFAKTKIAATAELTSGFLINGWGGGLYARQGVSCDMGILGLSDLVGEYGIIGGGGLALGPILLGATLDVGILTTHDNIPFTSIPGFMDQEMVWGYIWGLDVGIIFKPVDSFSIGVVCRDIVGSNIPTGGGRTTLAEFLGAQAQPSSLGYEFTFDFDFGITFNPDFGFVSPKFSFEYYNVIDLFRYGYDNPDATAEEVGSLILNWMRIGASVEFFDFLQVGGQYYNHFFAIGAGVDLAAFQLYGEFIFSDTVFEEPDDAEIGVNIILRLHFFDPSSKFKPED